MSGGAWRYEVVSGTHKDHVSWVELREQFIDADGQKLGRNHVASAETSAELADDLRAQLAAVEAYIAQEQQS